MKQKVGFNIISFYLTRKLATKLNAIRRKYFLSKSDIVSWCVEYALPIFEREVKNDNARIQEMQYRRIPRFPS